MNDLEISYEERFNLALRREHEKVFDPVTNRLKSEVSEVVESCPLCSSKKRKIYCVKDHFIHLRCKKCSFVYLNPRLNDEATFAFYNSGVNEIYNEVKFHDDVTQLNSDDVSNINNYKLLKNHLKEVDGLKILEIGPGRGAFLKEALKDGMEPWSVELNKALIEQLNKICVEVFTDDLLELELEQNFFDVIYFRDVIEHIPKPLPFLKEIFRISKPGGLVMIDTHNIDSLINMATRKYHTVIFAFEHPVHWSPKTLKYACGKVGFQLLKSHDDLDLDFSIKKVLEYYMFLSFTYIYKPHRNRLQNKIFRIIRGILNIGIIRRTDITIFQKIEKLTKKASKMQVIFKKPN